MSRYAQLAPLAVGRMLVAGAEVHWDDFLDDKLEDEDQSFDDNEEFLEEIRKLGEQLLRAGGHRE